MIAVSILAGMLGISAIAAVVWFLFVIFAAIVEKVLYFFPQSHKMQKYRALLTVVLMILFVVASYFVGRLMIR